MNIGNLEFKPIIENKNLIPKCIYDLVNDWDNLEEKNKFMVTEINPDFADGNKLCEEYNIDKKTAKKSKFINCFLRNDFLI